MKKIKKQVRRRLKAVVERLDNMALRMSASSRLAAGVYYLIKGDYGREQRASAAGKLAYRASLRKPGASSSLLRRNVHRVEKGLLMRPRRVPFGLNYIGETVAAYATTAAAGLDACELRWATDVLDEYMAVTPSHPAVDPLRAQFRAAVPGGAASPTKADALIPYVRDSSDAARITYEDMLALARYRRSVRWFLPEKVLRSEIDRALDVAAYSPSACNRQPFRFMVFDEPQLVEKVIALPMGTGGFGHQVPALAVVVGQQRNYFGERDRHLIYVDGALAAMSFVYGLEVQGLGSCCINWPDVEHLEQSMQELLKLDADERPIMLIAIGHPDPEGMVARSVKKPLSIVRTYNLESNDKSDC
ncbi:nitroreductase family protein [Stenotrophomonas sp. TWI1183]|uniref:nitroreductase family protein n=1 Tax=Stenotrophomonas sp. TWI1183 TaxID=3136799 RepID=UPI003207B24A